MILATSSSLLKCQIQLKYYLLKSKFIQTYMEILNVYLAPGTHRASTNHLSPYEGELVRGHPDPVISGVTSTAPKKMAENTWVTGVINIILLLGL